MKDSGRAPGLARAAASLGVCLVVLAAQAISSDCTRTSVGLIPLTELGTRLYLGKQGGLYPGGSNIRPSAHEAAGLAAARALRPLDARGAPDDSHGKIVFISVGMSNTTQEFSTFKPLGDADPAKNPKLVIVDGAQGGATASLISNLTSPQGQQYWNTTDSRLAAAGVTPAQVQAAWIKEADAQPTAGFPNYALQLKNELAVIARILKTRYPNIRIAYLSSRIYAGYASTALNPEPYAYESGFSVKWLIEDQINGAADLNFNPDTGPVMAPWLAWGPYLWADGLTPRSDGLTYKCSDFNASDGTHPATPGAREKVARLLLDFLKSDSAAKPWFLGGSSLIFPALIGRAGPMAAPPAQMFTGMALANLDLVDAALTFTAFDKTGRQLTGPGIRNPVTMSLKAGAQIPQMDFQIFGDGVGIGDAWGWFRVDSTVPRVSGFFMIFDGAASILDGTNASTIGTREFIVPDISDGDSYAEIHTVNSSADATEIRLELFGSAGQSRAGAVTRIIEGNGALIAQLSDLFATGLQSGDYLRVTADREVVPVLFWGNSGRYLKALEGRDTASGAVTLYAPQYAVGGTWRSTLSVVNLDDQPGEISFEFTDRSGNSITRVRPIAPRGKIFIDAQDFFVDPSRGICEGHVKIAGSGVRLAGNVVFGDSERQKSATSLPLVSSLQSEVVFSHLVSDASYYTGVALLNPNNTETSVIVEVHDSNGKPLATYPTTVAGSRSAAFVLSTLPELQAVNLGSGYIRVKASQPIASFALFATHNNSVVSAIPSQSSIK
jgi:hypothetical protein